MAALHPLALIAEGAQWDFVQQHVDGYKFWSGHLDTESEDSLRRFIELFNHHGIQVMSERMYWPPRGPQDPKLAEVPGLEYYGGTMGPFDDSFAARAAEPEIRRLNHFAQLGGRIDYIDIDGPFRNLIHPDFPSLLFTGFAPDEAVRQIVNYMLAVQRVHPEVRFFAIVNLPLWGYKGQFSYAGSLYLGDYFPLITKLIEQARACGAPLAGVTVDFPYDMAIGAYNDPAWVKQDPKLTDWIARIIDLETEIHSRGLEFNLILNSHSAMTSHEQANRDIEAYRQLYIARGGLPNRFIVQSWYTHPTAAELLPESDPASYTGLLKRMLQFSLTP